MSKENKPNFYAIIPADVRYDKRLTPNAKLLYGEITALCNDKGYCWASNRYFAELYSVSQTSISKWVNQLIEFNYIKSKIVYKEGTKEILNRHLSLIKYPIEEKLNTPIKDKLIDNTTTINNTINNTIEYNNTLISKNDAFSEFWNIYNKKQDKISCESKFLKLPKKDIENILLVVKDYVISTPDVKYRKNPLTWLNRKCWNDEIISENKPTELTFEQKKEIQRNNTAF